MPGRYYEDLEVGQTMRHALGRTITEADNMLFCGMTLNTQPLHINADFAARSPFGQQIVNGILTMGVVVGITVPELTEGTIVANLGYERVDHPHPVFHGDTITVETEVLSKRESKSRPESGIVRLKHIGRNQHGETVCEVVRTVMFNKRTTEGNGGSE